MFLGALRLRQSVLAILFLVTASALLVSCGSNNNFNNTLGLPPEANPAKIKVHVFVSNPLFSAGTGTAPVLNVVDGQSDLISPNVVSVGATSPTPGLMVLYPNKSLTLVFSASNNSLTAVNNATQQVAQDSAGNTQAHDASRLHREYRGGARQYDWLCRDSHRCVNGQSPGVVNVLNLSGNAISATLPIPGARFLAQSHDGSRIVVLGSRPTR